MDRAIAINDESLNHVEPNTCPLCIELSQSVDTPLQRMLGRATHDRLLWSSEIATLLPDISPIARGHLLLTANKHVLSFASLSSDDRSLVWESLLAISERMRAEFGEVAFAEHGSSGGPRRRGACIEHAHIHLIPTNGHDLAIKISELMQCQPYIMSGFDELDMFAGKCYLMYATINKVSVWLPPTGTASQVIRQAAWAQFGVSPHWDWAVTATPEDIESTISAYGRSSF